MTILKHLFYYLIFPGFLFASIVGMLAGWVDRKLTARIQYRVGPPWYQNFIDILKLFGKQIIIPSGRGLIFLLSPLMGLFAAAFVAMLLGLSFICQQANFIGDLIVVIYLLTIPAISLIIGASSCGNPLASVGASREMKMVLAYELPFILAISVVIMKTGSLRIFEIMHYQTLNGSIATSASGVIAFIVALLAVQAKLGFVPFDASEAEQEIMAGVLIEYSGLPLAVFRLTRFVLLYALPLFLIAMFFAAKTSITWIIIKYLLILIAIILIKNTNPRARIDQAIGFFWKRLTPLAIIALLLAFWGK